MYVCLAAQNRQNWSSRHLGIGPSCTTYHPVCVCCSFCHTFLPPFFKMFLLSLSSPSSVHSTFSRIDSSKQRVDKEEGRQKKKKSVDCTLNVKPKFESIEEAFLTAAITFLTWDQPTLPVGVYLSICAYPGSMNRKRRVRSPPPFFPSFYLIQALVINVMSAIYDVYRINALNVVA